MRLHLRRISTVVTLGALSAGLAAAVAPPQDKPDTVALDMSAWQRRDYARCQGFGRVTAGSESITIEVDDSALKYWQIPTLTGPLAIDPNWGWIKRCDRPPGAFAVEAREQAEADGVAIQVTDYPYVSWSWRISGTLDDSRTADDEGRISGRGDDFAAKIGFQMVPKGSDDLREIAYVWTRTIPEGTLLVQEAGALFWKYRFYRIVQDSGDEHVGAWRAASRNLLDDYKRIWPDEEPGTLLRVFVMTDGDNTGVAAEASYSRIALHRSPPADIASDR